MRWALVTTVVASIRRRDRYEFGMMYRPNGESWRNLHDVLLSLVSPQFLDTAVE